MWSKQGILLHLGKCEVRAIAWQNVYACLLCSATTLRKLVCSRPPETPKMLFANSELKYIYALSVKGACYCDLLLMEDMTWHFVSILCSLTSMRRSYMSLPLRGSPIDGFILSRIQWKYECNKNNLLRMQCNLTFAHGLNMRISFIKDISYSLSPFGQWFGMLLLALVWWWNECFAGSCAHDSYLWRHTCGICRGISRVTAEAKVGSKWGTEWAPTKHGRSMATGTKRVMVRALRVHPQGQGGGIWWARKNTRMGTEVSQKGAAPGLGMCTGTGIEGALGGAQWGRQRGHGGFTSTGMERSLADGWKGHKGPASRLQGRPWKGHRRGTSRGNKRCTNTGTIGAPARAWEEHQKRQKEVCAMQ